MCPICVWRVLCLYIKYRRESELISPNGECMKSRRSSRTTTKQSRTAASGTLSYETMQMATPSAVPKYRQIYEDLHSAIRTGALQPGDRLPSETELGERYNSSRITVAKALDELQLQGLVSRRAGSGTHVLAPTVSSGHVFGLLIPDLGRTEIFEPICHGMMQSPLSKPHSLLWGHSMGEAARTGEGGRASLP